VFTGEVHFRNAPLSLVSLLALPLPYVELGAFKLGRSKSRGYGRVRLELGDLTLLVAGGLGFSVRLGVWTVKLERRDGAALIKESLKGRETLSVEGRVAGEDALFTRVSVPWSSLRPQLNGVISALREEADVV